MKSGSSESMGSAGQVVGTLIRHEIVPPKIAISDHSCMGMDVAESV